MPADPMNPDTHITYDLSTVELHTVLYMDGVAWERNLYAMQGHALWYAAKANFDHFLITLALEESIHRVQSRL